MNCVKNVGMITFQVFLFSFFFFFFGAVAEYLICLIVLVVKLLTGFEALVPPLKNLTLSLCCHFEWNLHSSDALRCRG